MKLHGHGWRREWDLGSAAWKGLSLAMDRDRALAWNWGWAWAWGWGWNRDWNWFSDPYWVRLPQEQADA